jgi:hypothetical protein
MQCKQCLTVVIEDEFLILNSDTFMMTRLNAVGGYYWSLLYEVQTVESLVSKARLQFDGVGERAERELDLFLTDLLACGLIKKWTIPKWLPA